MQHLFETGVIRRTDARSKKYQSSFMIFLAGRKRAT